MNNSFLAVFRLVIMSITFWGSTALAQNTSDEQLSEEEQRAQYEAWAQNFLESLTMKTGTIKLQDGLARLDLTDDFYYLSAADGKQVLEEAWGNPPSDGGLGMVFPAQYTPLNPATWGVTITFEEMGYVEDDDAGDIDYDDLLTEMKADMKEANEWRLQEGYQPIELVGWAAHPYYDVQAKKLHWAKELKFGTSDVNTLNYNVRVLGRRGVLVLNFIASMDQLSEIEAAIPTVIAMTNFEQGNTYAEFDPDLDEVAAVGVAGLIAGKVLAKSSILVGGLLLLKKFWFVLIAAFVGLGKLFKGRKKETEQ